MTILTVLSDPILPVFAILATGFAAGRSGVVSVSDARTVNRIALSIFLPILLFGLTIDAPIREFAPGPLVIYALAELVLFAAGVFLARRVFRLEPAEAVLIAFAGIFTNTVFYVLPIGLILYGSGNVLPLTTVVTLDSAVTFGSCIVALQMIARGRPTPLSALATVGRSPILIAIVLGLAANVAQIPLGDPFRTFVDFNGAAAAPMALFALGVVLSRTQFSLSAPVLTFTAMKVAMFPAVVWLAVTVFAADAPGADQFVLAAAGPAGAMAFSLALLNGVRTDRIAPVIVLSSVLTLASLAVLA